MSQISVDRAILSPEAHQANQKNEPAANVLIGREADILQQVGARGVGAAIWQRSPRTGFQAWIDALPEEQLPELNAIVAIDLVEQAVQAACESYGVPSGAERDMLASDVAALAYMFGKVMDVQGVKVRLDVEADVMCPRFHQDNVTARLLCTYRGPATQYVSEAELENSARIGQMTTGSVGLFRGKRWPSADGCGLLHRSPHVTDWAGTRLLLVIDPAE